MLQLSTLTWSRRRCIQASFRRTCCASPFTRSSTLLAWSSWVAQRFGCVMRKRNFSAGDGSPPIGTWRIGCRKEAIIKDGLLKLTLRGHFGADVAAGSHLAVLLFFETMSPGRIGFTCLVLLLPTRCVKELSGSFRLTGLCKACVSAAERTATLTRQVPNNHRSHQYRIIFQRILPSA
jgi:hypothetical protein